MSLGDRRVGGCTEADPYHPAVPAASPPTTPAGTCRRIGADADPLDVLRAWPARRALGVLWSADPDADPRGARWSRWTVLAEPRGCLRTVSDGRAPGGCRTLWHGPAADDPRVGEHDDPLACLEAAAASTRRDAALAAGGDGDAPPFVGGWIVSLGYELGRVIEPRSASSTHTPADTDRPLLLMQRCPGAYVHDRATGWWWAVGAAAGEPDPEWLLNPGAHREPADFAWHAPEDRLGAAERARYERAVARVVEYIRAGDVFQANLAHTLHGRFSGSTRACFAAMVERSAPWFGAYVEDRAPAGRRSAIASVSPELFLDLDPRSRVVTTRPIKGTRRADAAPTLLESSGKDRAELAMIVDLMRNDLGRVCEFGSVRVAEARAIERHGAGPSGAGVWHGVATVLGRLREHAGPADLLRAAFPGGSITGAPKVRAMQIIAELEDRARGPYTGSIGYISDSGRACLNIAIRTALIEGTGAGDGRPDRIDDGRWSCAVGAGIVAESDPALEWEETLAKAQTVLGFARAHTHREEPCPTPATA